MTTFPAMLTVAPTADTPRHGTTLLSTRRRTAKSHRLWASPAKIPIKRMQGPARFAGKRHEDYCEVQRLPTPTTSTNNNFQLSKSWKRGSLGIRNSPWGEGDNVICS